MVSFALVWKMADLRCSVYDCDGMKSDSVKLVETLQCPIKIPQKTHVCSLHSLHEHKQSKSNQSTTGFSHFTHHED